MRWLFIALVCVAAQPSLPLLPSGVTIDMVKKIEVEATGTVEFVQSTDSSASITNRLSFTPAIAFDSETGVLTVNALAANAASVLRPGLLAAFLAVAACAFHSNSKHTPVLLCLLLGLGVAQAGLVVADLTIRIPGCWHTEHDGHHVVFDDMCQNVSVTAFQAPADPVGYGPPTDEWRPITPNISFYPVTDSGKHYLDPDTQYEVWRANFGRRFDAKEKENFLQFTERCRVQNMDPDRSWTASCNQFAILSDEEWKATILADNAAILGNFSETHNSRRLLEADLFSDVEDNRRKLLQSPESFSWVGTGKLTPVKDQGNCGSCYAHSAASQMEAQLAITKGTVPVPLSREQLKSCSQGSPGCGGGVPAYMFNYAKGSQGVGTEKAHPYVAKDTSCPNPLPTLAYKNSGYSNIANNEAAFKLAVQKAPVAVTVCASTWSSYGGGIFNNCASNCAVDHAVLLVGYGADANGAKYWLIQNSWNTWWGESGFIRLPRTDSTKAGVGSCGLTRYAGQQATGVSGGSTSSTAVPCQGSWSGWSTCSKTCGGGTQTRTWTTTVQPSGGGTPCPSPTTQSQSCNTALCPTPSGGGGDSGGDSGTSTTCLRLSNTVLGASGDGDYKSVDGWTQGFCGSAPLPQYYNAAKDKMLFFYATNCVNNQRTAGVWGLGPKDIPRQAYQWSGKVTISKGVIPAPNLATGWTIQFSQGTTCV